LLRFTFESQPSCHFLSRPVSSTQFIAVLSDVETFLKEVQQLDLQLLILNIKFNFAFGRGVLLKPTLNAVPF